MPFANKKGSINMTFVFLKKKDCFGYDTLARLELAIISNFSLRLNMGNSKSCIRHLPLAGQWQGQCIRLWRMHRRMRRLCHFAKANGK